eukprot:TRINITY_DN89_c0_g1_i8.p1 TRINITY_DN89_c0_g1~~TRINITY_DN89_c0_g1_i8.p1  ORF type:complete len:413 (-),score=126.09 TRINITY_DN89_c0_g1_i8:576-1814(-)
MVAFVTSTANILSATAVARGTGSTPVQSRMTRVSATAPVRPGAATAPRMVTAPSKREQFVDMDESPMTLTRFMIQEAVESLDSEHLRDMQNLMASIQMACKKISSLVSRAGISNLTGYEDGGSINIQGEEQKKLDVLSNDVLKHALKWQGGKLGIIASEEEDEPVMVDEMASGNYIAVFDPLDGSSNIDAGIATGTIFGIFAESSSCLPSDTDGGDLDDATLTCLANTMQPGSSLVAAGYCMYSSSCMMVLTTGAGVNGFTLDPQIGEFVLTHPNITIPKRGKIYSFNEANEPAWDPVLRKYISNLKTGNNVSSTAYSSRYIGSMVADVHRTLMYGGIFGYPADKKNPNGKLRLLYECAPMSFLVEQAGGMSTTGKERVLDVIPNAVHQRLPLILGSADDVQELLDMYASHE